MPGLTWDDLAATDLDYAGKTKITDSRMMFGHYHQG
jgi:hypothetical protein